MIISIALPNQFNIIQNIAAITWPVTYSDIISKEQLEYMMQQMYSLEALNLNLNEGHHFILAEEDGEYWGFAAYQHEYNSQQRTHIHKIYVLPEAQGRKVGSQLMHYIQQRATEYGSHRITLNVNRANNAQSFYRKQEYDICETVDIPLGQGYTARDYIMEKKL